jgi:hypothetical protein
MLNSEFLSAAYGRLRDTYGWTTSFASDPNQSEPTVWSGNPYMDTPAHRSLIDRRIGDNNFFCVSVMEAPDKKKRSKDFFCRMAVLLADDASPDDLFGTPSYIFETSPGNYQIGIFLDRDDPDTANRPLLDAVLQVMAASKLINADSSGNNVVRYGRLPVGYNTKQRESGSFQTKIIYYKTNATYNLADAVATFGLDLEEIRQNINTAPTKTQNLNNSTGTAVDLYRNLINPNLEERSYHDPLMKLSAAMVAAGMAPGAVVNNLRSLMLAIQPESTGEEFARWESRYGSELSRMVSSAEKYAPARQEALQGDVFVSEEQLEEMTKNVRWLVKGLVPEDSMGMIFGASGTYKSFIAIDMALHIAHGMDWAGLRTKQGPVAYIAAEGGAGISRRLKAWRNQFGLIETNNLHICITPFLLTAQDEMAHLKAAIAKFPQRPSVVIIDTLSQTFSGDENSSSDIGTYLRMINSEIRAAFNCTVIVIHHTGHSAAERPRGSSAITANLDFILGVFKPDPEASRAKVGVHKMKDGDKVDDLFFNMTRLVLGEDSDGDEISSLVAAHDEAGGGPKSFKASKYDSMILKMMPDKRQVTEKDIRDEAGKGSNETDRTIYQGVKRSLDKLHRAGMIRSFGIGVWGRVD